MKRRLFNAAAVLSLTLCIAVTALWARSGARQDRWNLPLPGFRFVVWSQPGWLRLYLDTLRSKWSWKSSSPQPPRAADRVNWNWRWVDHPVTSRSTRSALEVPHWHLALLFLTLPSAWLYKKSRRTRAGLACAACGYDLRGTPGSACPECGAVREAKRE